MNDNRQIKVIIENLLISTEKADEFIDDLEELCEKYSKENNYSFKYEYEE